MWKRILKYLIGAVTIVSLVIGTQIVTAETGLIVKLPKPITNIASELGQSFTLGMVGVAYATTPDYICDGVADDVEIQAAMNALPATGGELFFFGGNYVLTATVTRAINNISIVGSGKSTYFANDGGTALFSAGAQTGWVFENFRTDAGYVTVNNDTIVSRVWDSTFIISDANTATYTVASVNATDTEKSSANWICDGTNDDVEIQAALDALPTDGGSVHLTSGTFLLDTAIVLDNYQSLTGVGYGTILSLDALPTLDVLISVTNKDHIIISGMTLVGNYGTSIGMYLDGIQYSSISLIRPKALYLAIDMQATTAVNSLNSFTDIIMLGTDTVQNGIRLTGTVAPAAVVADNTFSNIALWLRPAIAGTGIDFVQQADHNTFNDTFISLNFAGTHGVIYNSGNPAAANDVYANDFNNLIIAEEVAGCTSMEFNDCREIAGGSYFSYITNLIVSHANPSVPVWNANSLVLLVNAQVASTRSANRGTASITGAVNKVTVTHGLMATPSYWECTPEQQGSGDFSIQAVGAATFEIHFENQPGAATWYFKWHVCYREPN